MNNTVTNDLNWFISSQSLTNCRCETFLGSVAEMKGNETRVVIFLQPVNPPREGRQVLTLKQSRWSFSPCSLLLALGTLLGLGVLGFVLYTIKHKERDLDSTAVTVDLETTSNSMSTTTTMSTTPTTIKTTVTTPKTTTTENFFPTSTSATTFPSRPNILCAQCCIISTRCSFC